MHKEKIKITFRTLYVQNSKKLSADKLYECCRENNKTRALHFVLNAIAERKAKHASTLHLEHYYVQNNKKISALHLLISCMSVGRSNTSKGRSFSSFSGE